MDRNQIPSQHKVMKKIGKSDVIGQQGMSLIEGIVLSMGSMFYPTGGVEAGIDGFIELRDTETGEVGNLLLQVQGKATERERLQGETEETFEFPCADADIEYWTRGTAPVLLIVVALKARKAYWKSLKEWFLDSERRKCRKVVFEKAKDEFTRESKAALISVATAVRPGASGPSVMKSEQILVNLLEVRFAPRLFWAPTSHGTDKSFGGALGEIVKPSRGEWIVRSKSVLSFHPLDEFPWKKLCDWEAMEEFDTTEWANSDDEDRQRDFVARLVVPCLEIKARAGRAPQVVEMQVVMAGVDERLLHQLGKMSLVKRDPDRLDPRRAADRAGHRDRPCEDVHGMQVHHSIQDRQGPLVERDRVELFALALAVAHDDAFFQLHPAPLQSNHVAAAKAGLHLEGEGSMTLFGQLIADALLVVVVNDDVPVILGQTHVLHPRPVRQRSAHVVLCDVQHGEDELHPPVDGRVFQPPALGAGPRHPQSVADLDHPGGIHRGARGVETDQPADELQQVVVFDFALNLIGALFLLRKRIEDRHRASRHAGDWT
jgi:Domain of unknown function (DUF4365)